MSRRLIAILAAVVFVQSCASRAAERVPASMSEADGTPRSVDSETRPFDEKAIAQHDIDVALLAAKESGKRLLLVFGGNWCHDSRGLAAKFEREPLSSLMAKAYEIVWIDVGHRDRNLDQLKRFGVKKIIGTPTVLILSPSGELLNSDTVHDWRTAESKSFEETLAYFAGFSLPAK